MNATTSSILAGLSLLLAAATFAANRPIPGPGGGRILTPEAPHAEFLVQADRKVAVRFYTKDLTPLAPAGQVVSAVAETKTGKVALAFESTAAGFVSRNLLPAGDDFIVVVQIRGTAGARPRNYRVLYQEEICDGCKRAEYACICEAGAHEHHHAPAPKRK